MLSYGNTANNLPNRYRSDVDALLIFAQHVDSPNRACYTFRQPKIVYDVDWEE